MLDHSALVRKLLREFRHGDTEEALRHALTMRPHDVRSRVVGWGARLPFRRAVYNLLELLSGPPRGGAIGVWRAETNLVDELKGEYRKAAERAVRQGDFRRGAYIFGMLLGDDRAAAMALQRGGMHHDAAILFLRKLDDKAAAASAFAAAGMLDRAIALYRELGQHEDAGELLRRVGDEAGAVAEFRAAAAHAREATPQDWLASGRILFYKAFLRDAAIESFRKGWGWRPGVNAIACARELVSIHAAAGEVEPLRAILDEADDFFTMFRSAREARIVLQLDHGRDIGRTVARRIRRGGPRPLPPRARRATSLRGRDGTPAGPGRRDALRAADDLVAVDGPRRSVRRDHGRRGPVARPHRVRLGAVACPGDPVRQRTGDRRLPGPG